MFLYAAPGEKSGAINARRRHAEIGGGMTMIGTYHDYRPLGKSAIDHDVYEGLTIGSEFCSAIRLTRKLATCMYSQLSIFPFQTIRAHVQNVMKEMNICFQLIGYSQTKGLSTFQASDTHIKSVKRLTI